MGKARVDEEGERKPPQCRKNTPRQVKVVIAVEREPDKTPKAERSGDEPMKAATLRLRYRVD